MSDRTAKRPRPDSLVKAESMRRYAIAWLHLAACRVYERGRRVDIETSLTLRHAGVDGLFDLSDTGGQAPVRSVFGYPVRP